MAIAHNAAPAAAGGQENQAGEESDRNLIHNSTLADEMNPSAGLDSRISAGGSAAASGDANNCVLRRLINREIRVGVTLGSARSTYFEIFNFTVPAGALSTKKSTR